LQDLPGATAEISHFRGKAALPTHALGISSFSKAFFLQARAVPLFLVLRLAFVGPGLQGMCHYRPE
jgi:hypothetical protein